MRTIRSAWGVIWPPLLFLTGLLAIWKLAVVAFDIIPLTLPPPEAVFEQMWSDRSELLQRTWITARAALLGLALSLVVGVLVAIVFASSRFMRRGGYPYAIFLQTVPIVAIAPLVIIWFGRGLQGIVIVSFIISVFPIITNTTTGLLSVDRNLEELFELHDASGLQRLFKLRLPTAVPFILAGLQISAGAAVIGAIVGEFFVGNINNDFGLGYLIRSTKDANLTTNLFAAVIASTLLGVAIFAAASAVSTLIRRRWFAS